MNCNVFLSGNISYPVNVFYLLMNYIMFTCTLVGNGLIITVIIKYRCLHTPTNIFLSSLAITDIIKSSTGQLLMATYLGIRNTRRFCTLEMIAGALAASTNLANMCILASVSCDRYLHLRYNLWYDEIMSKKKAVSAVLLLALVSSTIGSINAFGAFRITLHLVRLVIIICLLIMVIFYSRIWLQLKRTAGILPTRQDRAYHVDNQDQHGGACNAATMNYQVNPDNQDQHARVCNAAITNYQINQIYPDTLQQFNIRRKELEKRYIKSALLVTSIFFIAWIPLVTVSILWGTLPSDKYIAQALHWATSIAFSSGAVNPIIYSARYQDIREKLKQFLQRRPNGVS